MPGKKSKGSNPPPPPPPPTNAQWYNQNVSDNKNQPPPPYHYATMYNNNYGINAAYAPMKTPPEARPGAFHVWGIAGYTGNIDTSADLSPSQIGGRLAMIKQAMHGYNDYDPSQFPQASSSLNGAEPPRPPTPALTNKEPESVSEEDGDDEEDDQSQSQQQDDFRYYIPHPPPPASKPKKLKCEQCAGRYNQPVKKIKKKNGRPMCWTCVWYEYMAEAQQVWEDS